MTAKLGIFAGSGSLPRQIIDACEAEGRPFFIIALRGETDEETYSNRDHALVSLGQVGEALRQLRHAGCSDVVLAGPVRRPALKNLKLDLRAVKMMGKIRKALGQGDNAVLSLVVEELEADGFRVVGVDDLLGGGVSARKGAMGAHQPDASALEDIQYGIKVAHQLGALDIGQSVIIQHLLVLGVEAIEGTDALIERCGPLHREGEGGVLIKLKKPDQERRADLPTIGPRTIELAARNGLRGVAIEAGQTLVMDQAATISSADSLGLFVFGLHDL